MSKILDILVCVGLFNEIVSFVYECIVMVFDYGFI